MAEERQPPAVVEGAAGGDIEDEVQATAKSAEDRKAAAALAKLDTPRDDDAAGGSGQVDQEGLSRAMRGLGVSKKADDDKKEAAKKIKVDAADVALLVDELDLTKPKATELLKQHDGDAVKAMTAFITVN